MAVKISNRARPVEKEGEDDYFEWEVYLEEPDAVLDQIDHVIYRLHETFPEPIRTVTNREERFALRSRGWGEFTLGVVVVYKDGSRESQRYRLDLSRAWDEQ
jgi:transcription initiation factor IIF auxiliary subunit